MSRSRRSTVKTVIIVLGSLSLACACLIVCAAGVLLAMRGGVIPAVPFLYTPTPVPTPTATPLPWDINILDDFSKDINRWPVMTSAKYRCGIETMVLDSGALFWNINAMDNCAWYEKADIPSVTDFDLSVDVLNSSSNGIDAGLTFRGIKAGDRYYFGVYDSARKYGFFIFRNQKWTTLIEWTYSPRIRSGEVNRLRVVAHGSHFTLYVNETKVASIDDPGLASGYVGLGADLYNSGDTLSVKFDNFELQAKKK